VLTDTDAYLVALLQGDQVAADHHAAAVDTAQAADEARLGALGALAGAAAWYAAQGIPVFPCRPGAKRPATRHGLHDATCDPAQVAAWWAATPAANIGVPTGVAWDVIDTDGPVGCAAFGLDDLHEAGLTLLGWASTPHGWHYLVPPTGGGNRAGILPGVDYRGTGGYVIVPPSRTLCTRTPGVDCFTDRDHVYRWVRPPA
jgi:hypothetical protein